MISVIVPVYGVEPYLGQCVDSILCQTYADLEILLVDDGSPDRCGQICDQYEKQDSRVRVFHTENRGLSAARNLGILKARGEYIAFVDADDRISPEMYEVLLRRLREADCDLIVCGYDTVPDKKPWGWKLADAVYDHGEALASLIDGKINNAVWNKLYSSELLRRSAADGMLFPEGKNFEDVAAMYRIVDSAERAAAVSEALYHYRVRPGSITRSHTARSLMDYADARLDRFSYFRSEHPELYEEKKEKLRLSAAYGISKVWRWWYGCRPEEKQEYKKKIKELRVFTKNSIPLFGCRSWPATLRLSAFFMHSSASLSFAVLYALNQAFRKLRPEKTNAV